MDSKTIAAVNRQVYQKYPEVRNVTPKVKEQASGTTLLIYETTAATADGLALKRSIRAMVNADGKITKLTASK